MQKAPTPIVTRAGSNLEVLCVWYSDASPFCENLAKLYFGAKHVEIGLDRGW